MKKVCVILFCFFAMNACSNASNSTGTDRNKSIRAEQEDVYRDFKHNCASLDPDIIHRVDINDAFIVELPEIPSSGYLWHFKLADSESVELVKERVFDFNKPDVVGGTQKHLWKFKALNPGSTTIVFKKYRQWLGEEKAKQEYQYIVNISKR